MRPLFKPFLFSCALLNAGLGHAVEAPQTAPLTLILLSSGGFIGAVQAIAPEYQKNSDVKLNVKISPSWGTNPQAIPNRLDRKEPADLILTERSALDRLIARGQVDKFTRVDLGESFIAMAVHEGAAWPDISSMKAFRRTLLNADSIAYPDSASGAYLSHWLFPHMKLDQRFMLKTKIVPVEPIGNVVARGEAQVGLQQLSELVQAPGMEIVGLIPDKVQKMILYSGAVVKGSAHPIEAKALLDYMGSKRGQELLKQSGLKPMR